MEPKIDEYFFAPLKFCKCAARWMSFTGKIRKTPFSILIAIQREMHQSEKAQRKNLVQATYKKDIPKFPPLSLPFGYTVDTN